MHRWARIKKLLKGAFDARDSGCSRFCGHGCLSGNRCRPATEGSRARRIGVPADSVRPPNERRALQIFSRSLQIECDETRIIDSCLPGCPEISQLPLSAQPFRGKLTPPLPPFPPMPMKTIMSRLKKPKPPTQTNNLRPGRRDSLPSPM